MYGYLYRKINLKSKDPIELVFSGSNLSDTIDIHETLKNEHVKKLERFQFDIKVYWKKITISLPTVIDADISEPTWDFYNSLLELTRDWLLADETRGIRQEALKFLVCSTTPDWLIIFKLKEIEIVDSTEENTSAANNRFERKYSDPKDIWSVVLAKEQMHWYTNPNKVKVRWMEKEMDLSTNYNFLDPRDHNKTLTAVNNFSWWIRDALFWNVLQDWNANPQHANHKRTTLLQAWQIDLIKRMWWWTVFICPRQMWKSMFLALMVIMELLSYNYYQSSKQRQILYLSYSVNAFDFVAGYIKKLMWNIPWLSDVIEARDNTIRYVDVLPASAGSWKAKKNVISECRFFTAQWRAPATWYSWDVIIIDEAMLISEKIWRGIEPIARWNWSKVLIATAYYPEIYQDKQTFDWPIKLCLDWEKESRSILDIDNHILNNYDKWTDWKLPFEITHAGLRYNVDDSEVTIDKEWWKKSLEDNQEEYMKQLYSVAPEKHQLFTYRDKMIQPHNLGWDIIVLSYDPAKTWDISALLVTGLSKRRWCIEIIEEVQLNKTDKSSYFPQANIFKTYLQKYRSKTYWGRIYAVMDNSHDWVQDAMIASGIRFLKTYRRTWGNEPKQGSRDNQINMPKRLMVEAALFLFDNQVIKIFDNCKELQNQLDHYFQYDNQYTKQSKFQWSNYHDDYVSAMLMALYTFYDTFNIKHSIEKLKNKTLTTNEATSDTYDSDDHPSKPNKNSLQKSSWDINDYLYNTSSKFTKNFSSFNERY